MNRTALTIAGAVGLAFAITFALKPDPSALERERYFWLEGDQSARAQLSRRFSTARRESGQLGEAEQRAMAAELAPDSAPSGLTMRIAADLPTRVREAIETGVRAELAMLGVSAPAHPVVVIATSDKETMEPRYRRAVVLPQRSTAPCTVVLHVPPRQYGHFRLSSMERVLGTCAFFAAYGTPSEGMRQWLRSTQLRRAAYLTPPVSELEDSTRYRVAGGRLSEYLGLRGCQAGRAQLCDEYVTPRDSTIAQYERAYRLAYFFQDNEPSPVVEAYHNHVVMFDPARANERRRITDGFLSSLASAVGPARFSAIWKSDEPVQGYARAEGQPLAAWASSFVRSHVVTVDVGSGLTLGIGLLTLMVAGLLFVATRRLSARRMD